MLTPCTDAYQTEHPSRGVPDWQICVRVPSEVAAPPTPVDGLIPPRRPDPGEFERFRHGLPTRGHFVYVLAGTDGLALYVGQSSQLRTRIRAHWRGQRWWPEVAEALLWPAADERRARYLEDELTQLLRPAYSRVTDLDRAHLRILEELGA